MGRKNKKRNKDGVKMNGSFVEIDKLQETMRKNEFYAEEMKKSLNNFKLKFYEIKKYYQDDNNVNKLYEKFEYFSKNFSIAYNKILSYNKVLEKVIENYENTNIGLTKKINDIPNVKIN